MNGLQANISASALPATDLTNSGQDLYVLSSPGVCGQERRCHCIRELGQSLEEMGQADGRGPKWRKASL